MKVPQVKPTGIFAFLKSHPKPAPLGATWGNPVRDTPPPPRDRMTGELLPTIHPEGTFTAEFVQFGETKRTRMGNAWYASACFETEHGKVYIAFCGTLDTLHNMQQLMKLQAARSSFGLKIKHREGGDGRLWADGIILYHGDM